MTNPRADRQAREATRCGFTPKNGRYYDQCRETAVWASPEPTPGTMGYREKRCQRHYDIDARTIKQSLASKGYAIGDWRHEQLVPFDSASEYQRVYEREVRADIAEADRKWERIQAAVTARDYAALRELVR